MLYLINKIKECFNKKLKIKVMKKNNSPIEIEGNNLALLLDDDPQQRKDFTNLFHDMEVNLKLHTCSNPKEYEDAISNPVIKEKLRVIIMDLSNTPEEMDSKNYKASEYIMTQYDTNRIPIFIHSGNLEHYIELKDEGTVFRVNKSKSSIEEICDKIKSFNNSGFLDIFSFNGTLENKIMKELHSSFITQYKHNEIEEIIRSINSEDVINPERTREVFERMAVRSLFSNIISDNGGNDIKLNSIEHYYRRTTSKDFWTGDIIKYIDETLILLTPRCNISNNNFENLLFCKIDALDDDKFIKRKHYTSGITDNVTSSLIGELFRFLPPSPFFKGGLVNFSKVLTLTEEDIKDTSVIISLSDEFTNDVVRKFNAYYLRGGLTDTNIEESISYIHNKADNK